VAILWVIKMPTPRQGEGDETVDIDNTAVSKITSQGTTTQQDAARAQAAAAAADNTKTTPARVIRSIAAVVAVISPLLAHWPIFTKNPTAAQAAIVVACLVIAAAIFTIQIVLAAVHEYGFSRAALGMVASDERKEIAVIAPDLTSEWQKAAPLVNETVPKLSSDVDALTQRVAQLEAPANGTQPKPGPDDATQATRTLG
jgi:hypothetical protein